MVLDFSALWSRTPLRETQKGKAVVHTSLCQFQQRIMQVLVDRCYEPLKKKIGAELKVRMAQDNNLGRREIRFALSLRVANSLLFFYMGNLMSYVTNLLCGGSRASFPCDKHMHSSTYIFLKEPTARGEMYSFHAVGIPFLFKKTNLSWNCLRRSCWFWKDTNQPGLVKYQHLSILNEILSESWRGA